MDQVFFTKKLNQKRLAELRLQRTIFIRHGIRTLGRDNGGDLMDTTPESVAAIGVHARIFLGANRILRASERGKIPNR